MRQWLKVIWGAEISQTNFFCSLLRQVGRNTYAALSNVVADLTFTELTANKLEPKLQLDASLNAVARCLKEGFILKSAPLENELEQTLPGVCIKRKRAAHNFLMQDYDYYHLIL